MSRYIYESISMGINEFVLWGWVYCICVCIVCCVCMCMCMCIVRVACRTNALHISCVSPGCYFVQTVDFVALSEEEGNQLVNGLRLLIDCTDLSFLQ